MSFYSRLSVLLYENKLTSSDFPVTIKKSDHTKHWIQTPEELMLLNEFDPEWKLVHTHRHLEKML